LRLPERVRVYVIESWTAYDTVDNGALSGTVLMVLARDL
jgi:hypothetical protein